MPLSRAFSSPDATNVKSCKEATAASDDGDRRSGPPLKSRIP